MKVLVTTFGGDGGKSGVSQYIIQFLRHCREFGTDMQFDVLLYEDEKAVYTDHDPELNPICQEERFRKATANILWHQTAYPAFCRKGGYDVVFIPGGNRRLPWRSPCPTVATCHDLGILHVPDKYDAVHTFYNRHVLPMLLRRQTHILTVSEASKRDIVAYARVPESRVTVTYNGVDHNACAPGDAGESRAVIEGAYSIPAPYLLYIARIDHPAKNHIRLIEAFGQLKSTTALPHKLVLAGSDWCRADEVHQAAAASPHAADIVFTGFVPGADLIHFYRGADAFVFPSLFEGFGIPIVEAMNCGIPVACGNSSCLPEIAGDAAVYFDAHDIVSMAVAMERILTDTAERERCIARGREQALRYDWRDSARRAVEIIREVGSARQGAPAGSQTGIG